jgi:hypothetical protein
MNKNKRSLNFVAVLALGAALGAGVIILSERSHGTAPGHFQLGTIPALLAISALSVLLALRRPKTAD